MFRLRRALRDERRAVLGAVRPLDLRPPVRYSREGKLWNEFIARYRYLGYKTLVGAQMRYAIHDRNGAPLAMLGFGTAARKLASRDRFIGWTPELREKNLPLVIDNPRFLILPWITIPNLGSHILSLVGRAGAAAALRYAASRLLGVRYGRGEKNVSSSPVGPEGRIEGRLVAIVWMHRDPSGFRMRTAACS